MALPALSCPKIIWRASWRKINIHPKKYPWQRLLILKPEEARLRAALYELEAVLSETIDEEGNFHLLVRLPKVELEKLFR